MPVKIPEYSRPPIPVPAPWVGPGSEYSFESTPGFGIALQLREYLPIPASIFILEWWLEDVEKAAIQSAWDIASPPALALEIAFQGDRLATLINGSGPDRIAKLAIAVANNRKQVIGNGYPKSA